MSFNIVLNKSRVGADRMSTGKLFQSLGAIEEKARSPYLEIVRGLGHNWRWAVATERSRLVDEEVDVERKETRSCR